MKDWPHDDFVNGDFFDGIDASLLGTRVKGSALGPGMRASIYAIINTGICTRTHVPLRPLRLLQGLANAATFPESFSIILSLNQKNQ